MIEGLRPDNPLAQVPYLAAPFSPTPPGGIAALSAEVARQASPVAAVARNAPRATAGRGYRNRGNRRPAASVNRSHATVSAAQLPSATAVVELEASVFEPAQKPRHWQEIGVPQ